MVYPIVAVRSSGSMWILTEMRLLTCSRDHPVRLASCVRKAVEEQLQQGSGIGPQSLVREVAKGIW